MQSRGSQRVGRVLLIDDGEVEGRGMAGWDIPSKSGSLRCQELLAASIRARPLWYVVRAVPGEGPTPPSMAPGTKAKSNCMELFVRSQRTNNEELIKQVKYLMLLCSIDDVPTCLNIE